MLTAAWHPQQLLEQPAQQTQVVAGTQGLDVALNVKCAWRPAVAASQPPAAARPSPG